MTVDPATLSALLRKLTACRQRNKDLSTKVVQLTQSRDGWKRKAISRSSENSRLRRKLRPRTRPFKPEYGPDVVQRILTIPTRDVK